MALFSLACHPTAKSNIDTPLPPGYVPSERVSARAGGSPELQPAKDSALWEALTFRKEAQFRSLLQQGADANERNATGMTPLMRVYTLSLAQLLLEHGADVRATDSYGDTPLHYADDPQIAALLLSKGADLHAKNRHGRTPLLRAAQSGRSYRVAFLLKKGARASDVDNANVSAVLLAVGDSLDANIAQTKEMGAQLRQERLQTVRYLLDAGADVNVQMRGYEQIGLMPEGLIGRLLIGFVPGETALLAAAQRNDLEIARLLLDHGAKIDAFDMYGRTALLRAARLGYAEVVQLLVDRGARLEVRDENGMRAMDYARAHPHSRDHARCEAILLKAGARP